MSYAPVYARQVQMLREGLGCDSTDELIECLEANVIELREAYEVPPPLLHRKSEVRQHEHERGT